MEKEEKMDESIGSDRAAKATHRPSYHPQLTAHAHTACGGGEERDVMMMMMGSDHSLGEKGWSYALIASKRREEKKKKLAIIITRRSPSRFERA